MAKFGMDEKKPVEAKILEKAYGETVEHVHVPGRAYEIGNPTDKLIHMIGGGFFNEPKYYDSNRTVTAFYAELLSTGKISSRILDEMGLTEQARAVIQTATDVANSDTPEDLLVVASWARDKENGLKLRTTPQIMLVVAAAHPKTKGLVAKYGSAIMTRPDEITQVFAAFRHLFQSAPGRHKGSLPHGLRKALAQAFAEASDYGLVKYNQASRPNFADVLKMIGGKKSKRFRKQGVTGYPVSKAMYEFLVNGKVTDDAPAMIKARQAFFSRKDYDLTSEMVAEAGLTWEDVLSHLGNIREVWEVCIPHMGEMALTRNLRNFEQAKICDAAWLRVYEKLEKVKDTVQLPFRFFSADKEVSSTEAKTAVGLMLDRACATLPDLPGVTLALCDNSGSATGAAVSGKSGLVVSDAGNILMAILAKRLGVRALCGVFGDSYIKVPFSQADSALTIKKQIDEVAQRSDRQKAGAMAIPQFARGTGVGGGTETGLWWALKDITDRKVHVDRIILLSDLCCYTQGDNNCGHSMTRYFGAKATIQGMVDTYRHAVNKDVTVYSINLNGHEQSQLRPSGDKNYLLSGWSEKLFTLIRDIELGSQTQGEPTQVPPIEVLRTRYLRA